MSGIDQRAALDLQLAAAAGNEPPTSLLEIRTRRRGGPMRQRFFPIRDRRVAATEILTRAEREDVYWGVNPRVRASGRADAIERSWSLFVDADTPDAVEATLNHEPAPSLVIRSGGGGIHAYWPLADPLEPEHGARANRRLAHRLGADMNATDAARILRPAGTLNHKFSPARRVECVRLEPVVFTAPAVVGDLPDPVVRLARAPGPPVAARGDDALASIPATFYVPALTGREVGRDGKVTCPFHAGGEERTPSLHAYPDPDRGWTCFGCGLGGTIIDFGAALYGLTPRGHEFHRLRRRLAGDLLPHVREGIAA